MGRTCAISRLEFLLSRALVLCQALLWALERQCA